VKASRRRFLQLVAAAPVLVAGRGEARSASLTPQIHNETRNTRFGARGRRWPSELPETPPARLSEDPAQPLAASELPAERHSGRPLVEVVEGYRRGPHFGPKGLDVSSLASLLHFTNGVTRQYRKYTLRAAPSAGALYAGEVYVVVARVEGLSPGLYYYDVAPHRLLCVRKGSLLPDVQAALERPAEIADAAFAIVLTNVFGRYSWRYANRAYRYALIDSGHIGENLRLAASSAGLADASPLRFCDDVLNDLLGVDGRSEAACALHAIGTPGESHGGPAPAVRRLVEKQEFAEIKMGGRVTERYHEATKLLPAERSARAQSEPPRPATSATPATKLPLPSSPAMTIEAAIDIRVQLSDLSFVLKMAAGSDALRRTHGVRLFAVAHRVAGLDPGVYEYLAPGNGLALVRAGARVNPMLQSVRQRLAGTAAVGLIMAAQLSGGSSTLGERWYRDLLLESGAMSQRIYLAAESLGLAGRNLAAFIDDSFNEKLDLAALGLSTLHLTVIGNGN